MTADEPFANVGQMKAEFDVLFVAARLVEEMGDSAARVSRVKLVETTAANEARAADFWRQVLQACEARLAGKTQSDNKAASTNRTASATGG